MTTTFKPLLSVLVISVLSACASHKNVEIEQQLPSTPESWQQRAHSEFQQFDRQLGLKHLISNELQRFLNRALEANQALKIAFYDVEVAKQAVISSGSDLWPSLEAGLGMSRNKPSGTSNYNSSADLSVTLRYELDLWGKLSANERKANLQLAAAQAGYRQQKNDLVREIISQWYSVVEANQQLALYKQRLSNAKQNLDIIELGYEQGLNEALDVYLSRNELATEKTRVNNQQQLLQERVRSLQLLSGQYPDGALNVEASELPLLSQKVDLTLPSEVVSRHPSLQQSWASLMAADATVAFAHKQRFPSFSISASAGSGNDSLSKLVSDFDLGWSLIGNITQPLFQAGALKANEESARLSLKAAEQSYMQTFYQIFNQVEGALVAEDVLAENYQVNLQSQSNAVIARDLSFEQYLKGLVTYTTVLEAQTRAFNAQSSVIELAFNRIENHLTLFQALGGDFISVIEQGEN